MPLLFHDEPPPCEIVNPHGTSGLFLLCDHASYLLPRALGTLGLSPEQIREHIGWDIGAAQVARHLSRRLDARLVLSGYSRLAIDCNRPLHVPSSIPTVTAGIPVPGNVGLSDDQRIDRQEALFWPYHHAIMSLLADRTPRALISVHSFTPSFPGQERPWPVSVVYGKDRHLAGLFYDQLRVDDPSLLVGDNEPYQVTPETDYGIPTYGEQKGIPALLLEIRQDGIASQEGALAWADRIARAYLAIEPKIRRG
jgi:predicted N-formylglutamate amidohydrolase